ncbi:MAG: NAD-dependent malic enzyme [bacterium ADurb.Bin429]|nr:MAG: NAD-dependent malic enzyme [bacterium ADurb.Bin429]
MATAPSASFSILLRLRASDDAFQRVTDALRARGGEVSAACGCAESCADERRLVVLASSLAHAKELADAVRATEGVEVLEVTDRTFALHDGGKIAVCGKMPLETRDDLSMAYTPGVARVCMAVHDDVMRAHTLTIKRNTVAVVTAPRCFDIEDRLKAALDIPVFHDDQHGTAVVVLAALYNALKLVDKRVEELKIVVSGVGASGVACSKILMNAGVRNIIGCDRGGAIYHGRTANMNSMKEWYAEHTNPEGLRGTLSEVIAGADLFLGLSGPGTLKVEDVKRMAPRAIIFAMANPVPEIMPEEAGPYVAVMATGRSDYPNQINNVLAFPGIFRGALDCRARAITENMKLAAARAIADTVTDAELLPGYIIPSVFNPAVGPSVARAVIAAATADGVARLTGGEMPAFDALTR